MCGFVCNMEPCNCCITNCLCFSAFFPLTHASYFSLLCTIQGLKYGANIVANLLDNNNDGIVDDAAVLGQLAQKKVLGHGAVLMCGSTRAKEQKESFFEEIFAYSFSCQTFSSFGKATEFKAIMFEESFHMIHQNGWAVSYPDIFGLDSYTSSVVCRETARHQCTSPGYFHPENTCPNGSTLAPGSPQASPLQGTCNYPSCDCAEFYRQAATAYMNWVGDLDFWYADHMPNNKADFVSMSSSEMLSVMENPAYHQPQAPLSGVYTQTGMTGTLITPAPTQAPTTAAPVPDPSPAPTTAAPTASPPTTTGTCFDSVEQFNAVKPGVEGWTKLKTCDVWVNRKNTPWRCKNVGGVKENCPKTCTNCCVETIGTFILKYNGNEKDCAWAAINPSVRCRKPPTRMNCAVVCGECE